MVQRCWSLPLTVVKTVLCAAYLHITCVSVCCTLVSRFLVPLPIAHCNHSRDYGIGSIHYTVYSALCTVYNAVYGIQWTVYSALYVAVMRLFNLPSLQILPSGPCRGHAHLHALFCRSTRVQGTLPCIHHSRATAARPARPSSAGGLLFQPVALVQ